jgi:arsenite methyltransferase
VPSRCSVWTCPRRLYTVFIILVLAASPGCTALKRWLYEGFGRDAWQHPEEVVLGLQLKAGDDVADLGSGSGYFTFRLADAVGPTGKVYAVDIDPDMTDYVARRARELNYRNIEVITAKPDDPLLPAPGVDFIFTCITYHHLKDRTPYLSRLRQYLRAHGRLAIIDFNGEGWFTRLIGHWTPREVILQELQQAGYSLQQELTFLPNQVFLVFSP